MLSNQKKNRQGITLEEMLLIPDVVYMSNWSKMASLIMTYEQITWKDAGVKARELFKIKEAKDYLRAVRVDIALESSLPEEEPEPTKEIVSKKRKNKKKRYQKNYQLLLKLAPELEQRLFDGERVIGGSERTGCPDVFLCLFERQKKCFFLQIAQNDKRIEGHPTFEMKLLLDMENRRLEALSFRDVNKYIEVYQNHFVRKIHHIDEKKQQNAYLTAWLKELIRQGHKIEFDFSNEPFVPVEQQDEELEDSAEISNNVVQEKNEKQTKQDDIDKLTRLIKEAEMVDHETARLKAISLQQAGKEKKLEYLLKANNRLLVYEENTLYRDNYDFIMLSIPLLSEMTLDKLKGTIKHNQPTSPEIHFEKVPSPSHKIHLIGFHYEEDPTEGMQIIAVNPRTKKAWLVERTKDFNGNEGYNLIKKKPNRDTRLKVNRELIKWLLSLEERNNLKIEILKFKQGKEIEWDTDVNSKIPKFEPGNVQLVTEHEKAGLDQEDIDWINQHQRGLTLTPILKISDETRLFIKKLGHSVSCNQGFRISRTGKLFQNERFGV